MGISLILRHGWQPKSTQKHVRNTQVVPVLYSRERSTLFGPALTLFLQARFKTPRRHALICSHQAPPPLRSFIIAGQRVKT